MSGAVRAWGRLISKVPARRISAAIATFQYGLSCAALAKSMPMSEPRIDAAGIKNSRANRFGGQVALQRHEHLVRLGDRIALKAPVWVLDEHVVASRELDLGAT